MELCETCGAIYFEYENCPICNPKPRANQSKQTKEKRTTMGFKTVVTPEDLKKGDLVPPGWYTLKIDSYEEKEAGTDKSINCIFHFSIQDDKYKGVTANKLFNEKALTYGKTLWKALGFPFDPKEGYTLSSELFEQTPGSVVMGYVKRGTSNKGNDFNDVTEFKAVA